MVGKAIRQTQTESGFFYCLKILQTMCNNNEFDNETNPKSKELGTLARLHNSCQKMQNEIAGFSTINFETKAKLQAYLLLLAATAEKEIYNQGDCL